MTYDRRVSICGGSAADLAGEVAAALAAASLALADQNETYSQKLVEASESVFKLVRKSQNKETYTADDACGGEARGFYTSSSYKDELVWAGTWLFFATGNYAYLRYTTDNFELAVKEEMDSNSGIFYWDNKIPANAVLLTRLRYLHDPGYPYEAALTVCSDMVNILMCSYLSYSGSFNMTPGTKSKIHHEHNEEMQQCLWVGAGGLLLRKDNFRPLQYAATAAFLSSIYSDYLNIIQVPAASCGANTFSVKQLQSFAKSQVDYILGNNPLKMSYMVGFGDNFPQYVHHRAASIPSDGRRYSCSEGKAWLSAKDPNPNVVTGAMVAGPDKEDQFLDQRELPEYTEPSISGNAGLVAALVALLDYPVSVEYNHLTGGMDSERIFANIS
ncbi:Endoglucanase 7 [Ananas comosus]|uniref:Endoglucanase n=1 Tax=Ananas comosus TaxID=4615 RepID=A0A199VRA6_ANACO|nr:Endoglucanase 7 [Ananas comosus]